MHQNSDLSNATDLAPVVVTVFLVFSDFNICSDLLRCILVVIYYYYYRQADTRISQKDDGKSNIKSVTSVQSAKINNDMVADFCFFNILGFSLY